MVDLIQNLESNDPKLVEEARHWVLQGFNKVKEPWLVSNLYESYLQSNSSRLRDLLVNVKESHHSFLFDKITESIKGSKYNSKYQALTLLGYVVGNRPTWIYRITEHSLMKDLLKFLKTEQDILLILSGVMPLIILIPSVPSLLGDYLTDIFDVYCRLAGMNFPESTYRYMEEQMVHMQVSLYALFIRLYGMYPCNFIAYLREQFRTNKSLAPIFTHTIKPMLDTVRMHPHLVTTPKVTETSKERWRKLGAEDVIIECEKFSLDLPDRCSHEACFMSSFRSRSSTTTSATHESPNQLQILRHTQTNVAINEGNFFSPSMLLHCQTPPVLEMSTPIPFTQAIPTAVITSVTHISQENSSPPEAAIEATPETTPIRDSRVVNRILPQASTIRSHTFGSKAKSSGSGYNSPINSQPSSPMRKDATPFNFEKHPSAFALPRRDTSSDNRIHKLIKDRLISNVDTDAKRLPPTSPLKIPADFTSFNTIQTVESPFSLEDQEVSQFVGERDTTDCPGLPQCDSVVHEMEGFREEFDDCEQEHGSPCAKGGLHMPNSKSINDFTKRIHRYRYSSQCAEEIERSPTESSPGNAVSYPNNQVRRTNSCPEMEKTIVIVPTKDNISKPLVETDEDGNGDIQDSAKPFSNGMDVATKRKVPRQCGSKQERLKTSETQTENFWPMPYEHLFLSIFPSMESNEARASSGALITNHERPNSCNTYDITDRYNELCIRGPERDTVDILKQHIELLKLQLHFEKHRREMHAFKNRRLLADTRQIRALEEHNAALRDQVQIKQKDVDTLTKEIQLLKQQHHAGIKEALDNVKFWENNYTTLKVRHGQLVEGHDELQKVLTANKEQLAAIDQKWQKAESDLIHAATEVQIAKEQAEAGERGRVELEYLNRELVLVGEMQQKYKERLNDISVLRRTDVEVVKLTEAYKYETQALTNQLHDKRNHLDACKTRIAELEHMLVKHDESTTVHKKQLNEVKEACNTKIKAVESKYQTQLAVNRCLEEKVVELLARIEICTKKPVSPDTSSCHEVNASLTDQTSTAQGLSPHSSPLSVSLASSEGSSALAAEPRDLKNLHKIVDQKDENNE